MTIEEMILHYEHVIRVVDNDAKELTDRAYGGVIREVKGKLQEFLTGEIVYLAWGELGGAANRIEINSKKIHIPIQDIYIEKIKNEKVKAHILSHKKDYYYGLSVDKHIFIDGKFVMGIECKSYTENAMLKRILVDFHLLKTQFPNISCHLFQLESQLGGDYSDLPEIVYGSKPTHSIMSYFPDVDLYITTLLQGERNIDEPIHKNFKPLKTETMRNAVDFIKSFLRDYV